MRYLRTNTATIVTVGPFLDKTDGVTLETALTITNERISFTVDLNDGNAPTLVLDNVTGATSGTSNDLNYITNNDAGLMQLELAAANVNYLGRAFLTITDAANHCPVFHEFMILPAMVYDSLIAGTDVLQADMTQLLGTAVSTPATAGLMDVNAIQLSGDATAANNAESFFDGTGYAGTNNVIPLVTTTTTATNLTNLPAAAATAAELAKVPKSDSTVSWNATALAAINAEVDTALNTAIPGSPTANSINERIATMDGLLLGTIAAGTHNPQTGDSFARIGAAGAGLTALPWNAAWDAEVQSEAQDAITASALATAANLATLAGYVDTEVAAILAAVDTEVAAIKTKTDYLPSATAGAAGGVFIAGANAATSITTALTANITGNLSGSVGSVTGAVGSVTGAVGSVTGAVGSVTAPVTAGTVSDKTGYALSSAGIQAIWDALTSALTTVGSVGKRIADNLDAAITSRGTSTYAGGDTSGTTTLLSRIVGTLASGTHNAQSGDAYARIGAAGAGLTALGDTRLANLDATVSSRNATTPPTVGAIADQVWDEAMGAHATPGTSGAILIDIIEDTSTTLPLAIASIGTIPATSAIANAVWDEALSGHATSGTAGKKLTDLANADLSGVATASALATLAGYVDTEVAAILADTNELQTDLVNGGRLDLLIDAIKAKTDNLPTDPADQSAVEAAITAATSPLATSAALTTVAGYIDTEVASILAAVDTEVAAIKAKTDNLPASPAAVGSAMTLTAAYDAAKTAATQTSVDDVPTNAELATALAGADDAMLTAIADVPTVAEFEARTLVAASYATAAALTAVDDFVDTEVAAIKAVTDKIDTALVLDGAVYQLTANALELAPTGGSGGLDAAGVRAAVGLALANLDTQLADLPTVAEMNARTLVAADYTVVSDLPAAPDNASIAAILVDTGTTLDALIKDVPTNAELAIAMAGADDATLLAIAALNNLSSAQAQTAATAALNAYDPPTNAEMVARTLAAAAYFDPATDTVARVTLADTVTTLTNMPATPSTADIKTALEADGSKLDHLWEMTADDGGVRQLTANALELAPTGGSAPTAGAVADAVWDEALSGHVVVGSAGAGLTAAGNAGDPWAITLPGDYTSDQAGYFISLLAGIDISAVTVTASNDAGVLTIIQSVTFGATVSGLTISGTWAKLYFTLKYSDYDDDADAILQLVESNPGVGTDGLLYLDGAAIALPILVTDGTLTVSQAAGTVAIAITDNATALLDKSSSLVWDIKTKDAAGNTVQNTTGTALIVRAVTQTI